MKKSLLIISSLLILFSACQRWKKFEKNRADSAIILEIDLEGSLQNPAFSPDGKSIVFTRFQKGYNKGEADLFIYNLETADLKPLISGAGTNVNLPGASWSAMTNAIVFSSERADNHDEIYMIAANGAAGSEVQITNRSDKQAFEPSFSPDGEWIVFESHPLDEEKQGVITKYKLDGSAGYVDLSDAASNLKQPNWSPDGSLILYQKQEGEAWDIWLMDIDGQNKQRLTSNGESTDAVFSQDGNWVIYSSGGEDLKQANIFKISVSGGNPQQLTNSKNYDGAPSISPDNMRLAFEGYYKNPEKSRGTKLCVMDL